jgi:ABC-type sugar transport system ATPase subunit
MPAQPIPKRLVSQELKKLMATVYDIDPDGMPITHARKLAILMVDRAIGYTEEKIDDSGTRRRIEHEPDPEFIKICLDRYEGKVPQYQEEEGETITTNERITEMLKERLNTVAVNVTKEFMEESTPNV